VDLFFDEPDFANYSNATAERYDTNEWCRQVKLSTIHNVAEMVRGIREGGPDFDFGVMAHARYNVNSAIRIMKALEPYDPMWVEEPIPPGNVDAMLHVQRQSTIPVAMGNRLKSRLEMREYVERGAVGILQPDAARIGGITEFRKVASWAETHWIPITPHNPNGPICLAANLALATSMSNFMILEEGSTNAKLNNEIFTGGWQDSKSHFLPPETPGLGIKFSDEFVREHSLDINTAERAG
jgi:galactonate dehydratase